MGRKDPSYYAFRAFEHHRRFRCRMGFFSHLMAAGIGAYVGANWHQHYQMRHLHCQECGKPNVSFFCSHRRGMTQHLDGASGPMTSSSAQQQEAQQKEAYSSWLPAPGPGPAHWHHWHHQQQQYQQHFQHQPQQPQQSLQQPISQQPPNTQE